MPVFGDILGQSHGRLKLCDIGVNLLDGMFRGHYHGKNVHEDDTSMVIDRARSLGVETMIITAGTVEESRDTIAFCRSLTNSEGIFSTVGIHPTRSDVFKDAEEAVVNELKALIDDGMSSGTVVAIGECGLDYDRLHFSGERNATHWFPETAGNCTRIFTSYVSS